MRNHRINIGEKSGGDDETRTRDLCRDSLARVSFTTTYKNAGTAKIPVRRTRLHELWVGLWVGNSPFHTTKRISLYPNLVFFSSGWITSGLPVIQPESKTQALQAVSAMAWLHQPTPAPCRRSLKGGVRSCILGKR